MHAKGKWEKVFARMKCMAKDICCPEFVCRLIAQHATWHSGFRVSGISHAQQWVGLTVVVVVGEEGRPKPELDRALLVANRKD